MNKSALIMVLFALVMSLGNVFAYGWSDFSSDFGTALSKYIPFLVLGILWPILSSYAAKAAWRHSKLTSIAITLQGVVLAIVSPALISDRVAQYYTKLINAIVGEIF
jgi:fucose permease